MKQDNEPNRTIRGLITGIKELIIQDAPPHAEQTLEEFLKNVKLPKPEGKKDESKNIG